MAITPQRAAQLAQAVGLEAVPMEKSGKLHIRYYLGQGEMRVGIALPLDESIESISERLDLMRGLETKPELRKQADRFVELLQAEEEEA